MQVFLVTMGSHGDVLPFVALGAELQGRGHAVRLAAPAPFAALADRAGLRFHPLGSPAEYDRMFGEPDFWHPRRGIHAAFAFNTAMTEPVFRWIEKDWRPAQGLVVASASSFGARVAQDRLGTPVVTVHVSPLLVESRSASPSLPGLSGSRFASSRLRHLAWRGADRLVVDPAALPRLNAFRAMLGLPPVGRLRHWWNSPLGVILMFPGWYCPPQPDWLSQIRQVGFPVADRLGDEEALDPDLLAFLEAGEPPLAFTYGSTMRHGAAFFEAALQICRRMGRRGILLSRREEQVPPNLPPDVVHVRYAPFGALLPRCVALVHHGGVGTVMHAFAAGIPQLVSPLAFDQFDGAERVERLGVGKRLSRGAFDPARAERRLRGLLSSGAVRAACRLAQLRMAGRNGVPEACDEIERLAGSIGLAGSSRSEL
ncbi:glycosyltransferase [uncultured Enterovirga sp.]|uniref:glycosyltransferase n=1 Tax=uncultured Enterovirga sp. TaxID=2026352 RepID=UPI0035CC3F92